MPRGKKKKKQPQEDDDGDNFSAADAALVRLWPLRQEDRSNCAVAWLPEHFCIRRP